jgi:hypothetical protein
MVVHKLLLVGSICRRKITVVASDGNDVEPVEIELLVAVSETYEYVVTIQLIKPLTSFFGYFRGSQISIDYIWAMVSSNHLNPA